MSEDETRGKPKRGFFTCFAQTIAKAAGSPWAFCLAACCIVVWAACGPLFDYSDTWQLVVNTSTTIITFLMVFIIQNTQNKDTTALQMKIDELVHVTDKARNIMLDLENLSSEEQEAFRKEFEAMAQKARKDTP